MVFSSYSEVFCVATDQVKTDCDADNILAPLWSLSFKPGQNTACLFPYINGALDDALWYEHPDHVRFIFEGRRCLLYPERAAAHFFDNRKSATAFIAPFIAFLNDLNQRQEEIQPNYAKIKHIRALDIFRLLPGTNCRDCGFAACMAFAAAVSRGKATADRCPYLSCPMSEAAEYPLFDQQGNLVSSLSLNIDTASLKRRIRELEGRIKELEKGLENALMTKKPEPPLPDYSDLAVSALTQREIEVLGLIAQGCTNIEIGTQLFISPHTVKSHMINIFNKFGVSDRTEAAVTGVRSGLI